MLIMFLWVNTHKNYVLAVKISSQKYSITTCREDGINKYYQIIKY